MRILLLMLLAAVSGCAITENTESAELVVKYSTLKVCDTPERASRCRQIASDVSKYANDTEYLTVALLMAAVADEVDWSSLDPADTILIQALLDRLQSELVERLGEGALPEDVRLATTTVAQWVTEASLLIG